MPATRIHRALVTAALLAALLATAACNEPLAPRRPAAFQGVTSELPTVTLQWNAYTRTLIERRRLSQQGSLRALAYVSLAQDVAARATTAQAPTARGQLATRLAIASASARVLTSLFPSDAAEIAGRLADDVERFGAREVPASVQRALAAGDEVGVHVVARASTDRFDAVWTGTVPTGPGMWFSSLEPPRPPLLPLLGQARTFFMESGDQFRPAPPPSFGSPAFEAALAEVRQIADTRTPDQQRLAEYWAGTTGALVAGYWNVLVDSIVRAQGEARGMRERDLAHVLAVANMAAWDANVACHDAKYTYWLLRPSQADPTIKLAIGLPNHPSYPSNHSCLSGAMVRVLGAFFPADSAKLVAMADEASVSRIYAGLHYRFDTDAGLEIADKVAALALARDRATGGAYALGGMK
jgi:hypothetical protein